VLSTPFTLAVVHENTSEPSIASEYPAIVRLSASTLIVTVSPGLTAVVAVSADVLIATSLFAALAERTAGIALEKEVAARQNFHPF
jgi:hypothetical protein